MKARLRSSTRRPARFDRDSIRRQGGFTLIQMLVVVAIFVIVAGMAVPSFMHSAQPMRLRNDAHALANLISMARMRATTEFAHVEVLCTTNVTPAYCVLESSQYPNPNTFVVNSELQKIYLSQGVTFGIPSTINTNVLNQSAAYQGDSAEGVTTTPSIPFNSRGLPVDYATGTTAGQGDYAFYLKDPTNNYYAVSVNATGHPTLYQWNSTALAFTRMQEYSNNNSSTQ